MVLALLFCWRSLDHNILTILLITITIQDWWVKRALIFFTFDPWTDYFFFAIETRNFINVHKIVFINAFYYVETITIFVLLCIIESMKFSGRLLRGISCNYIFFTLLHNADRVIFSIRYDCETQSRLMQLSVERYFVSQRQISLVGDKAIKRINILKKERQTRDYV